MIQKPVLQVTAILTAGSSKSIEIEVNVSYPRSFKQFNFHENTGKFWIYFCEICNSVATLEGGLCPAVDIFWL